MERQLNKVAYLTGSSRGIGRAFCEKLLAQGYFVVGLARTNDLANPNFEFQELDLSDLEKVKNFRFKYHGIDTTLLVNNAGVVGEIAPVGLQQADHIQKLHFVNTIAPQILTNEFIHEFSERAGKKHIVNISSGAGKHPIDAWAPYCSSKAALDLFAETTKEELNSRGKTAWNIHSVSPGVVDTQMQNEIRKADPDLFQLSQKFRDLKANNELSSPILVANKLFQIVENPSDFPQNLVSLRDF